MLVSRPRLASALFLASTLGTCALGSSGCGVFTKDLDGTVDANFAVSSQGNLFTQEQTINPDDNPDVRSNRSRIKNDAAHLKDIYAEITELLPGNMATTGSGAAYVKRANEDAYGPPVATFEGVPLVANQRFKLLMTPAQRQRVVDYGFSDNPEHQLKVKFEGQSDKPPALFKAKLSFTFELSAGVP